MQTTELVLDTTTRHIVDLTAAVARFGEGFGDGLVIVFSPHATVGLALMELGSGAGRPSESGSTSCWSTSIGTIRSVEFGSASSRAEAGRAPPH